MILDHGRLTEAEDQNFKTRCPGSPRGIVGHALASRCQRSVEPQITMTRYAQLIPAAALILSAAFTRASEPLAIQLWPGTAPGETEEFPPEANITTPEHRTIEGRPAMRISNVVNPTITVFRPDPAIDTGAAVVVCPGGGYNYVVVDLEGSEVCDWLNSIGVTGIVLKYRVPKRKTVSESPSKK